MFEAISFTKLLVLALILFIGIYYSRRMLAGTKFLYFFIWVGLGLAVIIGFSYRTEVVMVKERVLANLFIGGAYSTDSNTFVVNRSPDGHFYLSGTVANQPIVFLIDTGASRIMLSRGFAAQIPKAIRYTGRTSRFQTASDVVTAREAILSELRLGPESNPIIQHDVYVYIMDNDDGVSLLGMSFLEDLKSYQFKGDQLIITRD